jgi:hypothetical protein
LNLDAEDELEGRRPYSGVFAAIERRPYLVERLSDLVGDDVVVTRDAPRSLAGVSVVAWSPTPRARELVASRGGRLEGPDESVLRRVTSRRFSSELGLTLEQSVWVDDPLEAARRASCPSPTGTWLARRAYGFAGRGRRRVGPSPSEADVAFCQRAAREGGLLLEPLVARLGDFGLHGWIDEAELVVGQPTVSEVDHAGVWRATRSALSNELVEDERRQLRIALEQAADALRQAGYFGPFGVDAFRYRWGSEVRFNPRCEVNARLSMGWAIGMRGFRWKPT